MRWLVVLALPLALSVAPAAAAATPKACPLLKPAEVRKALGSDIVFREARGTRLWQSCTWHGEPVVLDRSSPRGLLVMVSRVSRGNFLAGQGQNLSAETVRGVGDLAYTVPSRFFFAVWSDGWQIEVSAVGLTTPRAAAKGVAKAALARL